MSSTTSSIPVVDFSSLSLNHGDEELDETGMKTTADEIINAFSTFGFAYLSNTQFPEQLVRQCFLNKMSSVQAPGLKEYLLCFLAGCRKGDETRLCLSSLLA